MRRNRHQRWLRERAIEAQRQLGSGLVNRPSAELQSHLIEDARRANDAALPWWEQLFYVYRTPKEEEFDCDL